MSVQPRQITREDLEASFRAVSGEVRGEVQSRKQQAIGAGIAILSVVVVIAFLLGRRAGKRKTTIVEIRRV
jgi:hypothetical protein